MKEYGIVCVGGGRVEELMRRIWGRVALTSRKRQRNGGKVHIAGFFLAKCEIPHRPTVILSVAALLQICRAHGHVINITSNSNITKHEQISSRKK
jgi:hypothetical protein